MDLMASTITISSVFSIGMFILGFLTYKTNKKKVDNEDTDKENQKVKDNEARLVKIEALLVNIDKNTDNLNQRVDSHDKWLTRHESRISVLETKKGK